MAGNTETNIAFNLLNDMSKDKALLSILNGVIIYDGLE
jgi:hypothetical protein